MIELNAQPMPHGTGPEIAPLVMKDIEQRVERGVLKYGEPLRASNGRDALIDAYEEALDLVMYLRQEIEQRKGESATTGDNGRAHQHNGSITV